MSRGKPARRRLVAFAAYGMLILSVPALLAAIEAGSWAALKYRGEPRFNLFYVAPAAEQVRAAYTGHPWYDWLDPMLSHANPVDFLKKGMPDFDIQPGFVAYANPKDKKRIRIFALGGSTTEPYFRLGPSESDAYSYESWPYFLQKRLDKLGVPAVVFNGGVAGYSSNQELLKLLRDVLPLKPDLVLVLNGENDQGLAHSHKRNPMIHPYQAKVFGTLAGERGPARFFPNAVALARNLAGAGQSAKLGVTFGPDARTTPWDMWERNVRLMHAACAEFGVDYLAFRQPVLGVGRFPPTTDDAILLKKTLETPAAVKADYHGALREFYGETDKILPRMPYVVDFVDIFGERPGMYRDGRHQTPAGAAALADAVVAELQRRNVIAPAAASGPN